MQTEGHILKLQWLFPSSGIKGVCIFLSVFSTMKLHCPTISLNKGIVFSFNQAIPRSLSS